MWPFALVFVFVFVIPILYAVYISFFQKQMIGGTKVVGINNYIRLFHDPQFWGSVWRVALFTMVQVPIMLFLSAAMALALDSMKLHGAKFFRITTFYTPNMYAYNLSFAGSQSNYAAALAITMAVITMAIAYAVQLNSMKEQMK